MAKKNGKMPKGMPPKGMSKKMPGGMHKMPGGMIMKDSEMKQMMGGGKKRKGKKNGKK